MILAVDTFLLDRIPELSLDQLVFLSIVLNEDYQKKNQELQGIFSRFEEENTIQSLVDLGLLSLREEDNNRVIERTDKLRNLLKEERRDFFEEFYELFPTYVVRPDGTKGYLRANVNKCKKEYLRTVGKSRATHEHICDCLKFELMNKFRTGKIGYMKTMWKWLTNHEWEAIEDQMRDESHFVHKELETFCSYGTELL